MHRLLISLIPLTFLACQADAPQGKNSTVPAASDPSATKVESSVKTPLKSPKELEASPLEGAPPPGTIQPTPTMPTVNSADLKPLAIAVASPQKTVRGTVRPVITFNRPIQPLGARDTPAPATIAPAIPGKWRWLGSTTVEFSAEKPAALSTEFTVRVAKGLKAIDGSALSSDYTYTFETARIRPRTGKPVSPWNKYKWVRPDQTFQVTFTQKPDRKTLEHMTIKTADGQHIPLIIEAIEPAGKEKTSSRNPHLVRFKANASLPLASSFTLDFAPGLGSVEGPLRLKKAQSWTFQTYGPLQLTGSGCPQWHGTCPQGPVWLAFSNPVSLAVMKRALRIEPPVKISWPEDTEFETANWRLYGDFKPATQYTVTLDGVVDIFGQILPNWTEPYLTGNFDPDFQAPDHVALLERGLRNALPLFHMNKESIDVGISKLSLKQAIALLHQPWKKNKPSVSWRKHPLPQTPNQYTRSPLDLGPALDHGYGLVRMRWNDGNEIQNAHSFVQVTTLGVYTKLFPTGIHVWAWTLADGQPASGAEVRIYDEKGTLLGRGITGDDGIAHLPAPAQLAAAKNAKGDRQYGPPFIAVEVKKGDNIALVNAIGDSELSNWRIGARGAWDNLAPVAEGMIFADRGIYRPGETVYIKGVLRLRKLGKLETPVGRKVILEITDPDGNTVITTTHNLSRFGGFNTQATLPKSGKLGAYSIAVQDPEFDLSWHTSVNMAEYRAPKFLVEVGPTEPQRFTGQTIKAQIEGRYLFGAAMSKTKVRWNATASPGRFTPKDSRGFVFGKRYYWWDDEDTGDKYVADGEWLLDDEGRFIAEIGTAETPQDRPQMYTVEAAVTDVDRQVVAGRATFPVHPASYYIGLRGPAGFATANTSFEVQVTALDAISEAHVPAKSVKVRLVRSVWHTVKKKNAWGAFETHSERKKVDIGECTVDVSDSEPAKCALISDKSGYHEIVAEATDQKGRKTVTSDSVWIVGEGYAAWLQDDDHRVEVVSDKATYDVGDTATLLVQSPFPEAEAWITVEREGVLWQKRIQIRGNATPIQVPITEDMIPNAFIGVVMARGRASKPGTPGDPGRPTFRIGYREVRVLKATKRLAVEIKPDAPQKRPGDDLALTITVKDHAGKGIESEVTVWAVDKGVLALTGYTTPDPLESLYRRRGLSARNASNLTHLIAQLSYGAKGHEQGGGGGGPEGDPMTLRQKFVTTPIFIGDAITDTNGQTTVRGKLPDNLTTFKLMAVAVSATDQAGHGDNEVIVNKPLMASPALPRTARPNDKFHAGIVVHSMGKDPIEIQVTAEAEGPIKAMGNMTRTLKIPEGRGTEVRFPFHAMDIGTAKLRFRVTGGGHQDAVEMAIPVRSSVRLETLAIYGETTKKQGEAIKPPEEIMTDRGDLEITLASSALAGLTDDARRLIEYPYGCLEQRTSRLLPMVALKGLMERYGEDWFDGKKPGEIVADNVTKIAAMQRPDGGFSYWPNGDYSHYWGTAYATLTLAQIKRAGYPIGDIDLSKAYVFLKKYYNTRIPGEWIMTRAPEAQALALYVLAKADQAQPELERQLYGIRDQMGLFGQALLASAMARPAASRERAKTIISELMNHAKVEAHSVHFTETDPDSYAALFHSDVRTTALVLQALLTIEPNHVYVPRIARHLLEARRGSGYPNTQAAGFALMTLAEYSRVRETETPAFTAQIAMAGKQIAQARFEGRELTIKQRRVLMKDIPQGQSSLDFNVEGTGRLYYGARLRFAPKTLPTTARDDGIVVQRWYAPEKEDTSVTSVTEGDIIRVHLRIATPKLRHYVAIEDPLPAGLEPVDASLATSNLTQHAQTQSRNTSGQVTRWRSPFNHIEMRDDRVQIFADRLPPGVHTYSYIARATTAGTFIRPPARAEAMYTPEISGRSDGGKFWIHPRVELSQQ